MIYFGQQNGNAYMFKNANKNSDIMKGTHLELNRIISSQEYDMELIGF